VKKSHPQRPLLSAAAPPHHLRKASGFPALYQIFLCGFAASLAESLSLSGLVSNLAALPLPLRKASGFPAAGFNLICGYAARA